MMCGDVGQNQSDTHDRRSKDIDTLEKEDCQAQDITKKLWRANFQCLLTLYTKEDILALTFYSEVSNKRTYSNKRTVCSISKGLY